MSSDHRLRIIQELERHGCEITTRVGTNMHVSMIDESGREYTVAHPDRFDFETLYAMWQERRAERQRTARVVKPVQVKREKPVEATERPVAKQRPQTQVKRPAKRPVSTRASVATEERADIRSLRARLQEKRGAA